MFSKAEIFFLFGIFLFGVSIMLIIMQYLFSPGNAVLKLQKRWQIESIDTMKYSRDNARADVNNPGFVDETNKQVADIAATGANYVAIDTPYDDEFLPVLRVWVRSARAHNLHIWFRGNFSGWEGWFGYSRIDIQTHLAKTKQFILNNPDLFKDGDIFTSCPECENGANLQTGNSTQVIGYRKLLIDEYNTSRDAFSQINKQVKVGYFSMNADVARAVMDKATTQAVGGVVVVDHYVLTPEQLASDLQAIAVASDGNIVLGEFGAPIPDIQGAMTDSQQSEWLDKSFRLLGSDTRLIGVNYWVNKGGSTALWNTNGKPKPAVNVITQYYQ
jgi:hypothetical protein